MARGYLVSLVLALALVGLSTGNTCKRDDDCGQFDFCRGRVCVERLDKDSWCNRDEMCATRRCRSNGKCDSVLRRLTRWAIAVICIAALLFLLFVCILGYCICRCRRSRNRDRDAEAEAQAPVPSV